MSTLAERVAGTPASPVIPGTATWAVMMESTPAAMALRKGTNSSARSRWASAPITGRPRWESTAVSPCPGKCFAVVSTPPSRAPRMKAAPRRATVSGSSPNDRMLMTGFSGLLLTSTTGAKIQCTPRARASRAVTRPCR